MRGPEPSRQPPIHRPRRTDSGRVGRAGGWPVASIAVCCLGLLWARGASAQDTPAAPPGLGESNERRASQTFRNARRLLDQGDFQRACQLFEESQKLSPSPGTLLNLGNCREQQRDLVRALAAVEQALALAGKEGDPARRQGWSDAAQQRIQALSARIPTLRLRPSPTVGASVRLNSRRVERFGEALRLNPGRHRLEAAAPGMQTHAQDIELVPGQRLELAIPVLAPSRAARTPAGVAEPGDSSGSAPADERSSRFGYWPWVAIGSGAALSLAGLTTGIIASSKESQLDDGCEQAVNTLGKRECEGDELGNTLGNAEDLAVVTDVLWIAGAIGAATGATLLIIELSGDEPAAATLSARCSTWQCGLSAAGRF